MCRIDRKHMADDEPIEQMTDGGEVLLDGWLRGGFLQRLDIGGDMQRLDIDKFGDAALFEPRKKRACRPVIGHAGILVADRRGEEFEEAAHGLITGTGNRCRYDGATVDRGSRW